MRAEALPYLDEHTTTIAAGAGEVWLALLGTLDRIHGTTYARAVGCADPRASGPRPLAEGSTVPGFRVTAAVPGSELVLQGRHRFSTYALIFRLEEGRDRTLLRAESRAVFPGRAGGLYRLLVVGTRGHVLAIRRLLSAVASRTRGQGASADEAMRVSRHRACAGPAGGDRRRDRPGRN
jgi:hypothetical protein